MAFPNDHRALKLIVSAQLILETVQTVMFTQVMFQQFTLANIDPARLNEVGTLWISVSLIVGLSTCMYDFSSSNPQW